MSRWWIVVTLALVLVGAAAVKQSNQPWYMRETAMSADGRLTFLNKPWWPRAQALKEGESFTLDLNGDGRPDTLVTRKDGHIIEAIDDSGQWGRSPTCPRLGRSWTCPTQHVLSGEPQGRRHRRPDAGLHR